MKCNYDNKILNIHNKQKFVSRRKLNETLYSYRVAGFIDAGTIISKYYEHHIMKRNKEIVMINVFKVR